MWVYSQSTGQLWHDDIHVGGGYSGCGDGKNNPLCQDEQGIGPIPQGMWTIDAPFSSSEHGPFCLRLSPAEDTVTWGRSGFLIHGDSLKRPGEASKGCIILPRELRERIWDSDDPRLKVIP